jgi:hypothetical protein
MIHGRGQSFATPTATMPAAVMPSRQPKRSISDVARVYWPNQCQACLMIDKMRMCVPSISSLSCFLHRNHEALAERAQRLCQGGQFGRVARIENAAHLLLIFAEPAGELGLADAGEPWLPRLRQPGRARSQGADPETLPPAADPRQAH